MLKAGATQPPKMSVIGALYGKQFTRSLHGLYRCQRNNARVNVGIHSIRRENKSKLPGTRWMSSQIRHNKLARSCYTIHTKKQTDKQRPSIGHEYIKTSVRNYASGNSVFNQNVFHRTHFINQGPSHTLGDSRFRILFRQSYIDDKITVHTRCLWTSGSRLKEESKVEKTVKVLKEKVEEEKKKDASEKAVAPPKKKSLGQRVIAEVKHYYSGFKLLFIDVRICGRLLWTLLKGNSLTRRERKQLVRTTADLFRLVPFLVFIVVPFMEFLLPVALKLFPGMLPSTFSEANKEQEKIKKTLKVKLEMAKFLHNTIEESALQKRKKTGEEVGEFAEFIEKMRNKGMPSSNEEILKFSKLFEDEITLDNLSRGQLLALCKLLELPAVGTNIMLEFQLRMRLRQLKFDDKMIAKEGIENLTIGELQQAVRERGMRALGVPEERLLFQLQQWLDLHLKEQIPSSLLLLSRAMYLPETLSTEDQLKETIAKLPEKSAEEVKLKVAEAAGETDNKTKLELIKQEEEAIKREKEEIKQLEADEKEAEAKLKAETEAKLKAEAEARAIQAEAEELVDTAPIVSAKLEEELETKEEELSTQDLETIESVLEQIAEEKHLEVEMEELRQIKEDVSEYQEDLQDLREVVALTGGHEKDYNESKAAKRLSKRLNTMISQLDTNIGVLQSERMDLMEDIEVSEVRLKRSEELKKDDTKMQDMLDTIQEKKKFVISINEMVEALKRLQKVPDDMRLQRIAEVLDEDKDGQIEVDHLLKVLETLGSENVKLSGSQISRVINLMKKEYELEEQEKMQEKQEKIQEKEAQKQEQEQEKEAQNKENQ